jgi:hypothetical protein
MADPNIISKSSEVRQNTRVLSLRERQSLNENRLAYKQVLEAGNEFVPGDRGAGPVNLGNLKRNRLTEQQKQIEDTLRNASPEPISEKDRDAFVKRRDWLKEQFREVLETRAELGVLRREKPEWQSATKKATMRISGKDGMGKTVPYEQYIAEYQSICRRLEPENEDAGNLHELRKDR